MYVFSHINEKMESCYSSFMHLSDHHKLYILYTLPTFSVCDLPQTTVYWPFPRSEKWLHYFWQEFFSTLRIINDFAFIFVLELLRFIFHYVALRVLGGVLIVTAWGSFLETSLGRAF